MSRLLAPLTAFLADLRYPTLFKLTVAALLLSWLWPFDPLPFVDEALTLLATVWLSRLRRRKPAAPAAGT